MTRVALAPVAPMGPGMGGPGWRCWRLAQALSRDHQVTLLAPPDSQPPEPGGPEVVPLTPPQRAEALADFDVLVTQGVGLSPWRDGRALEQVRLLLDLYDPLPLELPHHYAASQHPRAEGRYADHLRLLRFLLPRAEAVVVANQRQRDLFLGMLVATGALGAREQVEDPWLDQRLLLVPSGVDEVPSAPPAPGDEALRIAWGGGTWGWFDLDTALLAAFELHREDPRYRLLLPGGVPEGVSRGLADHRAWQGRARRAKLFGAALELHPGWRPRAAFLDQLRGCRVGLCLAPAGLESRFSHRTRILDYLAAGLPCVVSGEDPLGDEGAQEGWAVKVPPGDVDAILAAVTELAQDGPARSAALEAVARAAAARSWEAAAEPLRRHLARPRPAARAGGWAWGAVAHQLRRLPGL